MRVRKEHHLNCIDCGREFIAYSSKGLRCDECRTEHLRRRKAAHQATYRSTNYAKAKARKKMPPLSIKEVLRRMERYNKENGTHLSYGQYVQRMESGKL